MHLPEDIAAQIEEICKDWTGPRLQDAAHRLMSEYREKGPSPLLDEPMVAAYLAIRAPATYAAVLAVLAEAKIRIPGLNPTSVLDLGSGPGTVAWAVREVYGEPTSFRAVEAHLEFINAGRRLYPGIEWLRGDLTQASALPPARLVTASYALGELSPAARSRLIDLAWGAAGHAFILIEPGTPDGFNVIEAARRQLLEAGATIAAPCPHSMACPLANGDGGWCHFSRRLSRTRRHRLLKDAERGWEDEKFAFLVATRLDAEPAGVRVLGHPTQSKISIRFEACTDKGEFEGLEIPRRDKEAWKLARKLEWGDGF